MATPACKFENRPYELGNAFKNLQEKPSGSTLFQNGVFLGLMMNGRMHFLGCSEKSCANNCRTPGGFHACGLLLEKAME